MELKVEFVEKHIEKRISYATENIESARMNILHAIENNGTADEIMSWCNNMKRAEQDLHEAEELRKLIQFLGSED